MPQKDRAGPEREFCSSRCPPTISFPAFTAVQDTTVSLYLCLVLSPFFLKHGSGAIGEGIHSASLQSCRDALWLWPCMNSTTGIQKKKKYEIGRWRQGRALGAASAAPRESKGLEVLLTMGFFPPGAPHPDTFTLLLYRTPRCR